MEKISRLVFYVLQELGKGQHPLVSRGK
jgi:hypothetical protein